VKANIALPANSNQRHLAVRVQIVDIRSRVWIERLLAHMLPGSVLNDDRRWVDRVDGVNSEGSSHDRGLSLERTGENDRRGRCTFDAESPDIVGGL
jgi:hypothetical protein